MASQFRMAQPPTTRNFLIASIGLAALWLSTVIVEPWRLLVEAHLIIDANTIPQMELWAPLTYALFPRDFFMLLFNVLMLYFFGTEIDQRWSTAKWWGTAAAAATLGGIGAALVAWPLEAARPLGGFSAPVMAFVAAYCWRIWDRRMSLFFVELTGKAMLGLFLALDALMALLSMDPTMFVARLLAAGVGLAVASGNWRPSMLRKRFQYWRVRRRMKVVARSPEGDAKSRSGPRRKRDDGTWIN